MTSTGKKGGGDKWVYRLSELDLPLRVVEMVQSLSPPSAEDMEFLGTIFQDYCGRLSTIQRLIQIEENTSSYMTALLHRAEPIARFRVMAIRNVYAAWRRLPVEVWDMIYAIILEGARKASPRGPRARSPRDSESIGSLRDEDWSAMQVPLPFLTVCKWWRAAVLSTPTAWTSITVPLVVKRSIVGCVPFIPTYLAGHLVPRLRRIANGSIRWSLAISFNGVVVEESEPIHGLPMSSMITFFHAAISSLELLKIDTSYFGNVLHCGELGSSFPLVSSLVLVSPGEEHEGIDPTSRTSYSLGTSPHFASLKKLTIIDSIDVYAIALPQAVPWAQLTHLLIQNMLPWEAVRALLILCNSLREVCFCIRQPDRTTSSPVWWSISPTTIVVRQHLKTLTIVCHEAINSFVLRDFYFPSLSKLRIPCSVLATHNSDPLFPTILPSLTHLTLKFCLGGFPPPSPRGIVATLDQCPSLMFLAVSAEGDLQLLLESLILYPEKPKARHLQELAISQLEVMWPSVSSAFPTQTLFDVVTSRRRESTVIDSSPGLKRVTVSFLGYKREINIRQAEQDIRILRMTMQHLVADGLELDVGMSEPALASLSSLNKHWEYGAMDFINNS